MRKNEVPVTYWLLITALTVMGIGSARAACVPEEGATTIRIDATNGCANIVGQSGCTIAIKQGETTCSAGEGSFTADALRLPSGATAWTTDFGIDTVIISGATKGNNCGYSYTFDASSGSGGFLKFGSETDDPSDDVYQNVNSVTFCTDGVLEEEPPPPPVAEPFPSCQDLAPEAGQEGLDGVGVTCPEPYFDPETGETVSPRSLVCNFQLDKENAGAEIAQYCCTCNVPEGTQQVCTAGTGECDEVIGDGATPDGRKDIRLDGGEFIEYLETPGCVYSRALNRWTCF